MAKRRISRGETRYVQLGDTIVPERLTLTQESDDPYGPHLTAELEVRNGRPECVGLKVTARPNGRGIRLRDLDVFSIDGAVRDAFEGFAVRPDETGGGPLGGRDQAERFEIRRDLDQAQVRSGPPRAELERVAQVYREHVEHRNPTETVAMVLGYTRRTAARRVQQARDADLLPPTTPGKRKA